jgi:hypothetical protein
MGNCSGDESPVGGDTVEGDGAVGVMERRPHAAKASHPVERCISRKSESRKMSERHCAVAHPAHGAAEAGTAAVDGDEADGDADWLMVAPDNDADDDDADADDDDCSVDGTRGWWQLETRAAAPA